MWQSHLPNHTAGLVADFAGAKAFVGRFTANGEVFVSGCQDRKIRLYHTAAILLALQKWCKGEVSFRASSRVGRGELFGGSSVKLFCEKRHIFNVRIETVLTHTRKVHN